MFCASRASRFTDLAREDAVLVTLGAQFFFEARDACEQASSFFVEVVDRVLQLMRSGWVPDSVLSKCFFKQVNDSDRPLQARIIDGAVID